MAILEAATRSCSVRKDVLRNFVKFTGKHICQGLYLIELQASTTLGDFFYNFIIQKFCVHENRYEAEKVVNWRQRVK